LRDTKTRRTLVFLTNQFGLPAATICALYKSRTNAAGKLNCSSNGSSSICGSSGSSGHPKMLKTQIWIAVSVYVLVAIVKKRLTLDASLYTLLQILSRSPSSRKSR
jgi:hypothetical protein